MKHFIFATLTSGVLCAAMCRAETSVLPMGIPAGATLEKLAVLDRPRFLAFSQGGDLVVGSGAGKVYRVHKPYTSTEVLSDFGGYPHSVAFRQINGIEELWVGDTDGLYKAIYKTSQTYSKADFQKVASLPGGGGHSSRTVKVGPDNTVFVSLGIANNCSPQYLDNSYPESERRGGIYRLDESVTPAALVPFARGLRNAVGFNWHPVTKVMYADNNGPDHWGFDEPREVFEEVHDGSFFGMPWYQFVKGKVTVDRCAPADKAPQLAAPVELPVATFSARSAPMDVQFVRAGQLTPTRNGSALVALHGSWAIPDGGNETGRRRPLIDLVEFVDGKATGKVTEVVTKFQDDAGVRFARPVGLAIGADGDLYFTSDENETGVYRLKFAHSK